MRIITSKGCLAIEYADISSALYIYNHPTTVLTICPTGSETGGNIGAAVMKELSFAAGCPGHPLLDAVLDLTLERQRDLLKRGTVLVDERDPGTNPRVLFFLEHAIQDASIPGTGRPSTPRRAR